MNLALDKKLDFMTEMYKKKLSWEDIDNPLIPRQVGYFTNNYGISNTIQKNGSTYITYSRNLSKPLGEFVAMEKEK
jgi:hypothetical protein